MKLEILNVTTAAEELHMSAHTVRLLFGRGEIAGAFKLGGRWFIRRRDLVQAIRKLAEQPAAATDSRQLSIPMDGGAEPNREAMQDSGHADYPPA